VGAAADHRASGEAGPVAAPGAGGPGERGRATDELSATARLPSTGGPGAAATAASAGVGESLIGDALLRELAGGGPVPGGGRPGDDGTGGPAAAGTVGAPPGPTGAAGPGTATGSAADASAASEPDPTRRDRTTRAHGPSPLGDTDVLGVLGPARPDDAEPVAVVGRPHDVGLDRTPDATVRESTPSTGPAVPGAGVPHRADLPDVTGSAAGSLLDGTVDGAPGSRTTEIRAAAAPGHPGAPALPVSPSGADAERGVAPEPSGGTGPGGAAPPDAGSDPGDGARSRRPGAPGGSTRAPSADTEGLGLADLLAGALAAYRNL
jgi:hypothetical protein